MICPKCYRICPECYRRQKVQEEYARETDAIIRILIERLGGKVVIADEEYEQAKEAGWRRAAKVQHDEEARVRVLTVQTF